MKVSVNWLRELLFDGDSVPAGEMARLLTMVGIEVEGRHVVGEFSGVVIAEVKGKKPHPNSNKLSLVDVFDGKTTTQVVCGAQNVPNPDAAERFVIWARPGATLPGGITLAEKEVRGVVSPGMLCAEDELGLGEGHEGILVLSMKDGVGAGDDLQEKLKLQDEIFELNVTPNRPDCLGHVGVARELAALSGRKLKLPVAASSGSSGEKFPVRIDDKAGCPRYSATIIDNVKVGQSPLKDRLRLELLGVRAISNVVDATNLAMLLYGQPVHAFDRHKLDGEIIVRNAQPGEKMVTLDKVERVLAPTDLVISDEKKALAIAGVMGGGTSEVTATTTTVILESAFFDANRVRKSAKRLGMHTEASHRFERGCDPNGVLSVAEYTAKKIVELAGGNVLGVHDVYPNPIAPKTVTLRANRTTHVTGLQLSAARQKELLGRIGIGVTDTGETLSCTVPTFRPDLTREVDLIEEILRHEGYDKVTVSIPTLSALPEATQVSLDDRLKDLMVALGFDEVVTYGFVGPKQHAWLRLHGMQPLLLANPIREELSVMRMSLIAGLLATLQRNDVQGAEVVRLFEVGETFFPAAGALPEEKRVVAGLIAGPREGWLTPGAAGDYFDIKGIVDALADSQGLRLSFDQKELPGWLHPGRGAACYLAGTSEPIGFVGEVHPHVRRDFGVERAAFAFEIQISALATQPVSVTRELPRFPAVTRDISFFINQDINAQHISQIITKADVALLERAEIRDDYREEGKVPAGKKSLLYSIVYRAADRTLTDAEVEKAHGQLLTALRTQLAIETR